MVKHSYEDTYPWTTPDKWGVTISLEAIRWAARTWLERLEESKQDLANLKDFNKVLENVYEKLQNKSGGQAVPASATPGSTQNRVPRKNYDKLWATCDAITGKCEVWLGTLGGERGKLGALCKRYLHVCGFLTPTEQIPEYENLETSKRDDIEAATESWPKSLAERKIFCKKQTDEVEKVEAEMKQEMLKNSTEWLMVLPVDEPASPSTSQQRATESPSQGNANLNPRTPAYKAISELKPKELLSQNISRPELIQWERKMRNYFKASNFDQCSNEIRLCYLEERMDPNSQQLLRKLCNGEPEKHGMETLYELIREKVVRTASQDFSATLKDHATPP